VPVVEAFLFGFDQRLAGVAVFIQVFGEANAVIDFVRLGFEEEIRFLGRVALEAEELRDFSPF